MYLTVRETAPGARFKAGGTARRSQTPPLNWMYSWTNDSTVPNLTSMSEPEEITGKLVTLSAVVVPAAV